LQIETFGRLVADLQCSLSPLDLNTQCGQIFVTVSFTVAISVTIAVSISGKRTVVVVKPVPTPPAPPKPKPKPDKTPKGWIVGVILFFVLMALCRYGEVTGPQAEQDLSHAVGQSSPAPSPSLSLHVQHSSHQPPRPRVRTRHGHRLRDSRHGS
jgi:hypothetical protein